MKKITMLMVAAIIALGGMSANGQNKCNDRCPLLEGITLTDAQKQKVEKLRSERRSQINKIRQESREKAKKIDDKFDSELRSMLTPDQVKTFDANKAKAKERRTYRKNHDGRDFRHGKNFKGNRGGKRGKLNGQGCMCPENRLMEICTATAQNNFKNIVIEY